MSTKETIAERAARLAGGGEVAVATVEKVEKRQARPGKQNAGGFGGARENAGRKPLEEQRSTQFQLVRDFADRELEITERNTRTGKESKKKMTVLAFTLETLLTRVREKDMTAIHEMLDRILGKAAQPLVGNDTEPIRVRIDF